MLKAFLYTKNVYNICLVNLHKHMNTLERKHFLSNVTSFDKMLQQFIVAMFFLQLYLLGFIVGGGSVSGGGPFPSNHRKNGKFTNLKLYSF